MSSDIGNSEQNLCGANNVNNQLIFNGTNGNLNNNNRYNSNRVRVSLDYGHTEASPQGCPTASDWFRYYLIARKNKKRKATHLRFRLHCFENLASIKSDIEAMEYLPMPSTAFVITRPKVREIIAADFRDRIIQTYLVQRMLPAMERYLHPHSYACRKGKGGLRAVQHLQEAIDKGLVKPEVLERAVKDVLRHKFRAGLFDKDAYLYTTEKITLDSPEERQTAYDIAVQSVVLLENNGILPLNHAKDILLTGPNANSIWAMCGDYTYPAMSYFWKRVEDVADHDQPHIVRLLEGMTAGKPEGVNLMYSRGCDWTEEVETLYGEGGDERAWEYELLHRKVDAGEKADRQEALNLARQADVIIAAVGENVMLCGENRDRKGLRLPGKQEQFVEDLIKTGKPVVLVMFGGRAQVVSGLAERCAAVIQAWYPGEEGGRAVADILYGKVSPSAKLSVSYPNTEINEPICYNYSAEKDARIQWPFGYGLTYTTFEYANLKVDGETATNAQSISLSFEVKNTGKAAADEVAQIYLSPTSAEQPIRPIQLQGFARVSLQPGESKTVNVKLYTEQFGYYTNSGQRQWNIAPGQYIVKVGSSSADIRLQETVTLTGAPVTKPLREYYFSESTIQD